MAETFKEVIQLGFETLGAGDAQKFADVLRGIGDAGGDADGKLAPLIDLFQSLADQSAKVSEAIDISEKITANNAALAEAKQAYADLNTEFSRTDKSSADISTAFQQAEKRVKSLATEQLKLQTASAGTNAALKAAGVDTTNLGAAHDALKSKVAGVAAQITQTAAGLHESGKASHEAAAGFLEVAEKSTLLRKVVDVVKELAAAAAGLFVLDKAKEVIGDILAEGDKAAKFGQQFTTAFGSIEAGAEALTKVKEIAEQVPLALDDVTASAIRAKKQGLDPLDGTLLTLINLNARYGGDVNSLNGLIDDFGKAVAKGAVSAKLLVSLQQQGIPATKLLGDAMGRSADEVLRLADSGQLGRQSLDLLLQQLGKVGSGGAAQQLGLLSSLTTKLKDQYDDFLQTIAQSGAYDFAEQQLQKFNAFLKAGLADGSIAAAAQKVSDVIVGIGKAVVGTSKFLYDHAAAVGAAVKGYVLFRTTLLLLDLGGAAAKMLTLAKATTAAGTAAEAAATGGGYAKLITALGKIPKSIQIGLAIAGLDFTLGKLEELQVALDEQEATALRQKAIEQDLSNTREQLAAKAALIATRLKGFADVQVASAEDLERQSTAQSKAYIEQLQNATRYYTALRIQSQQAGDSAGVAAATEKLKSLGVALAEVQARYKEVAGSVGDASKIVSDAVDDFLRLRLQGVDTAEALTRAFANVDIRTPDGVEATIAILKTIAPVSKEARDALQSDLVSALAKLDSASLRQFEQNVSEKLKGAKGDADALRLALGATLQAQLLNLGLSAEQAGVKISDAGKNIIATFGGIAASSNATGAQIQLAFAKALSQASTQGEVDALRQRLQKAFDGGKISADQFGVASEAAGRKLAEIAVTAATASAGLDGVGKAGESAGTRIVNSLEEARHALAVQEDSLAAQITAALAANDKQLADSLNAQIKSVSQQIDGLNKQIDNVKVPDIELDPNFGANYQAGIDRLNATARAFIDTSDTTTRSIQAGAESADLAAIKQQALADATDTASKAIAESSFATDSARGPLQAIQLDLSNFSKTAIKAFSDVQNAAFQFGISNDADVEHMITTINDGNRQINESIKRGQANVESFVNRYADLSEQQVRDIAAQEGGFDALGQTIQNVAATARAGEGDFALLNDADLSRLQSAAASVAAQVRAIKDQADSAKASLEDMASSFQDQIDQINGNQGDAENRQFQNTLDNLRKQAEASGVLQSQEYNDAVAKATALHNLKLQQIAEQAEKQRQSEADAASRQDSTSRPKPSGANGGGVSDTPAAQGSKSSINVTIDGKNLGALHPNDTASMRKLAEALTPHIVDSIRTSARATGVFGR